MFAVAARSTIIWLLVCALPLANAQQSQAEQAEFYRRQKEENDFWAAKTKAYNENADAAVESFNRQSQIDQNRSRSQGSDGMAALLILAATAVIVSGALLSWSRRPERKLTPEEYAQITQRHRRNFMNTKCTKARKSTLVEPRYDKPNSWGVIRIFQSDRAEEYKTALAQYRSASAEIGPTCKCVSDRSIADLGLTEDEWKSVAEKARDDLPWVGLNESRLKAVFEACAVHSPSSQDMAWIYSASTK